MEQKYFVYKHTCPSGKVYIGITKQNPELRWRCGLGYKHNIYFCNAIEKYGWENIKHEVLFSNLTTEEAAEMEIALIKAYKSNNREFGYNIDSVGFVTVRSAESREKISKSMIAQYANGQRPRVRSEETKRKTAETLKRKFERKEITRVISDEQKAKLSTAHKGKKLTDEHKEKIRQASHRKRVAQCDGEIVLAVFDGVREAGRETGIDYTMILKVISGKKKTAGGFVWRYL